MSADPIEPKNGVPYLARTRPSDLEPVDTAAERRRNHDDRGRFTSGNDAGRNHSAKRTLTKNLVATAQDVAGGALATSDAREVAVDALVLYGSNKRSVGATSEMLVQAPLLRNAVNYVVADRLTAEALRVGVTTERGMALLDLAHKCEARAERAMVAALAAAKALGGKRAKAGELPPWLEAEGEEAPTP